jgi:hypothetical protein
MILLLVSLLGVVLGVPFVFSVLDEVEAQRVWLNVGLEFLFLLVPASAAGVWLGPRAGLGARLLRDFVARKPGCQSQLLKVLLPSSAVGVVLGALVVMVTGGAPMYAGPGPLDLLLRSASAALTEEIAFRLGLMTLFAWILRSFVRSKSADPSHSVANLLAALLFAAAHLPGHVVLGTTSWSLIVGILVFNSIAGMAMGWLYARYGFISAVLAHFVGDVVGHVIPRFF